MNYKKVLDYVKSLQVGENQFTIDATLGKPDKKNKTFWVYNFTKLPDFPKIPPESGEDHVLLGATLIFKDQTVSDIKICWFDAP